MVEDASIDTTFPSLRLGSLNQNAWNAGLSRLVPYWFILFTICWAFAFFCAYGSPIWYEKYEVEIEPFFVLIRNKESDAFFWRQELLGFIAPLLFVATISTLLLTTAILPTRRTSWFNGTIAFVRRFKIMDAEHGATIHKKNQFGVGEPNFNRLAIFFIGTPALVYFCVTTYYGVTVYAVDEETQIRNRRNAVLQVSIAAAFAGTFCLSFFLIPVSRHSILLVAMNWNPVHALRFHVWAGYIAYFFFFLHGITIVGMWFKWAPGTVLQEIIPPKECWQGAYPEASYCSWQWYNLTGTVAFIFYTVLWGSSLNWFRRKWYRLFYILHVVFGTLAILASIWHFEFISLYFIPSIVYYLACTMPTLIQALASRFRGGVQIVEVVVLDEAGDCLEVRVSMDPTAATNLSNHHPSKFIKLCAPRISGVWHPFTVYNHPYDPSTMRMMIRPIGPFTKALRSELVGQSEKRPLALIDGFYRGSDHCQQALVIHDHVSIIAGGVALTPFISMIFAVLNELASNKESIEGSPILQSMTLIWSCRELGLLSFVKEQYLDDMVALANNVSNFDFKIKIHFTGDTSITKAMSVGGKLDDDGEEAYSESLGDEKEKPHEAVVDTVLPKFNHQTLSLPVKEYSTVGHPMELGRMMPGRYSRMIHNVPYFAIFTISVWLGFYIIFFNYGGAEGTFFDMSQQTYVVILVILFFLGVGIFIEGSVLYFRKYIPSSSNGDEIQHAAATSTSTDLKEFEEEQFVGTSDVTKAPSSIPMTTLYNFTGRPSANDMLADASRATAPGLYVCGPMGMIETLRRGAGEENSTMTFLTRYAIYEETFEM